MKRFVPLLFVLPLLFLSACNTDSTAQNASDEEEFYLDAFQRIGDTRVLMASLEEESRGGYSSYGGGGDVRNYLFFDVQDKSSRWLMPTNDQLFLWKRELHVGPREASSSSYGNNPPATTPRALHFLLISRDTNNNQRFGEDDERQWALADSTGQNFTILLDGITRYRQLFWSGDNSVVLFVERQGVFQAVEVDVVERRVINTTAVPQQVGDIPPTLTPPQP